jgi:AcrR family transcriptional regulator
MNTIARTASRKRLGGRTHLQIQQKEKNRKKLLDAGRALFARRAYATVTIDDIVARAKVSRATFYHHFSSKVEIVMSLGAETVPNTHAHYEKLAVLSAPSASEIADWVDGIFAQYEGQTLLLKTMLEVDAIEPEYHLGVVALHGDLIRRLGRTIDAFRIACSVAGENGEAWCRAHMLIHSIDYFGTAIIVRGAGFDRAAVTHMLAKEWHRFIEDGRSLLDV